jgi:hypothetical protein
MYELNDELSLEYIQQTIFDDQVRLLYLWVNKVAVLPAKKPPLCLIKGYFLP